MDELERLRLDYDQAGQLLRGLNETRFKLLALVPTLAGAVVAFVSPHSAAAELMAIGLLGAAATLGILVYELRNGEIAAEVSVRLRSLEQRLLLEGPLVGPSRRRLFGAVPLSHGLGVALVYGAAFAGWAYLVGWGGLRLLDYGHARGGGLAIGAAVGLAIVHQVLRVLRGLDRPTG